MVPQQKQGRSTVNIATYAYLEALAAYILAECCVAQNG